MKLIFILCLSSIVCQAQERSATGPAPLTQSTRSGLEKVLQSAKTLSDALSSKIKSLEHSIRSSAEASPQVPLNARATPTGVKEGQAAALMLKVFIKRKDEIDAQIESLRSALGLPAKVKQISP